MNEFEFLVVDDTYPVGSVDEVLVGGSASAGDRGSDVPVNRDVSSGDDTIGYSDTLSGGDNLASMTVSGSDGAQLVPDYGPLVEQAQAIHHDLILIIGLLLFFFAFRRIRSAVSGMTGRGLE